jgi:NADH:ubiquinone oxidoreductase subunit 2 (subunit N)
MLLAFIKEGSHLGGIIAILGSLLAIPYYFRVISYGISPGEEKPAVSFSPGSPASFMIFTVSALLVLTVLTGIFYSCLNPILDGAIQELLHPEILATPRGN